MNKEFYKFKKKEEVAQKSKVKFDVMVNGRFIKTLTMEYDKAFVTDQEVRAYAESKLPLSLKGENYEIFYLEK